MIVRFLDLPYAVTDGADAEDAMTEATDCLGSMLSIALQKKEEIPAPSRPRRGDVLVPVPLWIAPKVALYLGMREHGVNNSELARRLGISEVVVRRMLNPKHEVKAARMDQALRAVGTRLVVSAA